MLCKSCNLKKICKTYSFIKSIDHADIEITSCEFNGEGVINNEKALETQADNKPVTVYTGQAKPDLRNIEKKICNIPDKPEPIKVTCPTCSGITYDDDIKVCIKCGKPICSNCGTTADGQNYCNECWQKE